MKRLMITVLMIFFVMGIAGFAAGEKFSIKVDTNVNYNCTFEASTGDISTKGNFTGESVIFLKERAEAISDTAAYGQIWVDLATPNTLWFTNDAGTDFQLGLASSVTKVGTPVDNQVGVWTGDGTIEGDVDMTFDGNHLTVDGSVICDAVTLENGATITESVDETIIINANTLDLDSCDLKLDVTKKVIFNGAGDADTHFYMDVANGKLICTVNNVVYFEAE